jgi:hypothetical protein
MDLVVLSFVHGRIGDLCARFAIVFFPLFVARWVGNRGWNRWLFIYSALMIEGIKYKTGIG